jgi:hypothetical protein
MRERSSFMMRGNFVDLTEDQLNDLTEGGNNTALVISAYEKEYGEITSKRGRESWSKWAKKNDKLLREANFKDCDWYSNPLYGSMSLRAQAIEAGYRIKSLYPCYHQGWEMDAWGATGTKDGKYYVLETSHDSLCTPYEIELSGIEKVAINIIKFLKLE